MQVLLILLLHLAVLLPSRAARGVPRATSKFVDASNLKWLDLQACLLCALRAVLAALALLLRSSCALLALDPWGSEEESLGL